MYVRKDGKILYFENMKSQKNYFKLGRKPRETKWTEEFKTFRSSRMAAQEHAAAHKAEAGETKSTLVTNGAKAMNATKGTAPASKGVAPASKSSAKKTVAKGGKN
jgi:ribosomal protein L24E